MPEHPVHVPDRLTEALECARGQIGKPYVYEGTGPVLYSPSINYRGRVLWHHLSDAHTVATWQARQWGWRYRVTPLRVPGWDHVLWKVAPCTE